MGRSNRLKFDAAGLAYMCLGSVGDNSFYINAGNGTYPVHFETSALLPGTQTPANHSLGSIDFFWGFGYIKRWYPNPGDSSHYIEWDASATAFKIVGNVYATGQVAAGGVAGS